MPELMPMLAYLGPGGLLSTIGAFLALLAAVVLAVLGFVWLPLKRLIRALRERRQSGQPDSAPTGDARP